MTRAKRPAATRPIANHMHTGASGEDVACDYLRGRGYRILDRNWRSRHGELDIVAMRGDTIIAVEVKTRRGTGFGDPLEAITQAKLARLRRLFGEWLGQQSTRGGGSRLRIDAIGVLMLPGTSPVITHVEGVS